MNTEIQLFKDAGYITNPITASADVSDLNLRREDMATQLQILTYVMTNSVLDANSKSVVAIQRAKVEKWLSKARGEIK